jgi:hypothetical protein
LRYHDLDTEARQQPDRGIVDLRRQHIIDAAGKKRDASRTT